MYFYMYKHICYIYRHEYNRIENILLFTFRSLSDLLII